MTFYLVTGILFTMIVVLTVAVVKLNRKTEALTASTLLLAQAGIIQAKAGKTLNDQVLKTAQLVQSFNR